MAELKNLCVYCGSSNRVDPGFLDAAYRFGQMMGARGIGLVFGGGRVGMMGRVADGCLAAGGSVTGIIPRHLDELEIAHGGVTELVLVDTMHERKTIMAERADGFVGLPGGFGTLDEMFEIITWRQLGLHDKPIVFANLQGYWNGLLGMLDTMVAEGFVAPGTEYFTVAETLEAILPSFDRAPASHKEIQSGRL